MRLLVELRERLRALLFWPHEERAMDEELRFHLEMETQQLDEGMTPEEARRTALRRFGGVQSHKEGIGRISGIRSNRISVLGRRLSLRQRTLAQFESPHWPTPAGHHVASSIPP